MKCLWLTRTDPSAEDTGELIYSAQLIHSFAAAGAELTVLCLTPSTTAEARPRFADGIEWRVLPAASRPAWRSVPATLPNLAYRCALPVFRRALESALKEESWDVIVIDSLAAGWALATLQSVAPLGSPRRPRTVYVSHNHEESTRARVAAQIGGRPLRRIALAADARKAARLERRIVDSVDLVTAISPSDRRLYAAARGGRPLIELTPGYRGRRVMTREITPETPRRVVMVGSFEWGAKQANLDEFVSAAAPALAEAGIELEVVGKGGRFIETLRRRHVGVRFTGRVDNVYRYLDQARVAVVPERLGGGFKLKALDYVFNRLPIAALENAFDGLPLTDRESVLCYPDLQRLTSGLVAAVDDLPMLNRLQRKAYDRCDGRFDWQSRGRRLFEATAAL